MNKTLYEIDYLKWIETTVALMEPLKFLGLTKAD